MAAKRGLDRALDEMGGVRRRLAEPSLRIGAGDVEIAQHDMAQVVGAPGVGEHPFDHQLRAPIGRHRIEGGAFGDRLGGRLAVDRGGRRENEIADAFFHRAFDQVARLGRCC